MVPPGVVRGVVVFGLFGVVLFGLFGFVVFGLFGVAPGVVEFGLVPF